MNKRANGALGIDVVKKHKGCDGIPYFIIRLHSFFGDDFISNIELLFHEGISMMYEGQRVKELTNKDFSSLDEIDEWSKNHSMKFSKMNAKIVRKKSTI